MSREWADFYLTEDLLFQWRAATDMKTEAEFDTTTKRSIKDADFFDALYAEFVKQIRPLHKALLQDTVTSDTVYSYLHGGALDWTLMETTHKFYNRRLQTFNETIPAHWQKLGTVFELRTKTLSVCDKVKQMRQIHTDMKQFQQQSEKLESFMQEKQRESEALSHSIQAQGVKLRKYTHEYENGAMVPKFTNARLLSARLAALNRADVSE